MMTDFTLYITIASALYLLGIGIIIEVPNLLAAVIFRVLPIILGLIILLEPLKVLGLI